VQSSAVPTYTVFRSQFAALPVTSGFTSFSGGAVVPPLPAAGTVKVSAVTINGD
jgi:hypothetical protein